MKSWITEAVMTTSVLTLFFSGAFGAFGAMIHYLYLVVKEEQEYHFTDMSTYMFLGIFTGTLAELIMRDVFGQSYPGIILVCGFLTIKLLDFLNTNGLQILIRKSGLDSKDKDV